MTRLTSLLAVLAAAVLAFSPNAAARNAPFSDPASVGQLTLCDTRGHEVTHGDVRIKPFVWRAVGSTRGPSGYDVSGGSAALFAYQPLQGVDPVNWQGEYLTASATYTNVNRPMAAATAADPTLADYLRDFPTRWDGLVQLRMFLGSPQAPTLTTSYNSAVLRIQGTRWSVVSGGHGGCGGGAARSDELILPRVSKLGTPAPNAVTDKPGRPGLGGSPTSGRGAPGAAGGHVSAPGRSASKGSTPSVPAGAPGASGSVATPATSPAASTGSTSDSSALPWIGGGVAVLIALGAGGVLATRRRTTTTTPA